MNPQEMHSSPRFVAFKSGIIAALMLVSGRANQLEAQTVPIVRLETLVAETAEVSNLSNSVPARVRISRTGPTNDPLFVAISTIGTANRVGQDYRSDRRPDWIPAGASSIEIRYTATPDAIVEGDETIILRLREPSEVAGNPGFPVLNYRVDAEHREAVLTIHDDDFVTGSVVVSARSGPGGFAGELREGGEPGEFTVTRTGSLTHAVEVHFESTGTAEPEFDFSIARGAIIPAGSAFTQIMLWPRFDLLDEPVETLRLRLLAAVPDSRTGVTNGLYRLDPAGETVEFSLVDFGSSGGPPMVGLTQPRGYWMGERAGANISNAVWIDVVRTGPTTDPLLVPLIYTEILSTLGVDFVPGPTEVTIPAGTNRVSFPIRAVDDSLKEGNEDVSVMVGFSDAYVTDLELSTTAVSIYDDEPLVEWEPEIGGTVHESGSPIPLMVIVKDLLGEVTKVEFFAGEQKIGESTNALETPPTIFGPRIPTADGKYIAFRFDWTDAPAGAHVLRAECRNAADGVGSATLLGRVRVGPVGWPTIAISASTLRIAEPGGPATNTAVLTRTRSGPTDDKLEFSLSIRGPATLGTFVPSTPPVFLPDYRLERVPWEFPPGARELKIGIAAMPDPIPEEPEYLDIVVYPSDPENPDAPCVTGPAECYLAAGLGRVRMIIEDAPGLTRPIVSLRVVESAPDMSEPPCVPDCEPHDFLTGLTIELQRTAEGLGSPLRIPLEFTGVAKIGEDFEAPTEVVFPAGAERVSIRVEALRDSVVEESEFFRMKIAGNNDLPTQPYVVAPDRSGSLELAIIDRSRPPIVAITIFLNDGIFFVSAGGNIRAPIEIQASDDLITWETISTQEPGIVPPIQVSFPDAPVPQRFFRARRSPQAE